MVTLKSSILYLCLGIVIEVAFFFFNADGLIPNYPKHSQKAMTLRIANLRIH